MQLDGLSCTITNWFQTVSGSLGSKTRDVRSDHEFFNLHFPPLHSAAAAAARVFIINPLWLAASFFSARRFIVHILFIGSTTAILSSRIHLRWSSRMQTITSNSTQRLHLEYSVSSGAMSNFLLYRSRSSFFEKPVSFVSQRYTRAHASFSLFLLPRKFVRISHRYEISKKSAERDSNFFQVRDTWNGRHFACARVLSFPSLASLFFCFFFFPPTLYTLVQRFFYRVTDKSRSGGRESRNEMPLSFMRIPKAL